MGRLAFLSLTLIAIAGGLAFRFEHDLSRRIRTSEEQISSGTYLQRTDTANSNSNNQDMMGFVSSWFFSSLNRGGQNNQRRLQSNTDGPWPECIGIQGSDCVELIQTLAQGSDCFVHILKPNEYVSDFQPDRVLVYVNKLGAVEEVPARG